MEEEENGYDSEDEPIGNLLNRAIALSLAQDTGYDSEDEPIGNLRLVRQNAVRK